jgi:hypothetical protein
MSNKSSDQNSVRFAMLQEAARNLQQQLRSVIFENDKQVRSIRFSVDNKRSTDGSDTCLIGSMDYEGDLNEAIEKVRLSYPLQILATDSRETGIERVEAMLSPLALPPGWDRFEEMPSTFELTLRYVEPQATVPFPSVEEEKETNELREVVFLIHGIRDRARWQTRVKRMLEEVEGIKVIPIRYGYFDLIRFWIPFWTRQGPINRTRVEIQIGRNTHRAERYSVVAHSFGTYAISRVMSDTRDLVLHRLVLCGCIVDREFPWENIQSRITNRIVNDYGTRDIWPLMARKLSWGYGDTGRYGFGGAIVQDRAHGLHHSDFFEESFIATYWKPLFHDNHWVDSDWEEHAPQDAWWFELLMVLPWKSMLLLLSLLIAAALLWFTER